MKSKRIIILLSSISLSLFTINLVIAGEEDRSSITSDNLEALSSEEATSSPCQTAGGLCITVGYPIAGIHFSKD